MSTYLLYARVSPKGSTWSGTETTVPDQLRDGRAYVLARDPQAVFIEAWDELASADHRRMHALRGHLDAMRAGVADWDTLVFRHIDRVGRSALEVIQLGADLAKHGKGMIVYAMPFPTEPPIGPVIFGIFALLAEFERSMISARTKAKMVAIAAAGRIPYGTVPFGYRRSADNSMEPDPREAAAVRDIFRRYAAGEGANTIAHEYRRPVQSILNMLRRRTYLGVVEYDGQEYPGRHPAIIDHDTWNRAKARLPVPTGGRPSARVHPYLLSGLLRCRCGRYLVASTAHGRGGKPHRYYQCTDQATCRARWPADGIEESVLGFVRDHPITMDVAERAAQAVSAYMASQETPGERDEIAKALSQAKAEQSRLADLFMSGVVTRENAPLFNARLAAATCEVERLETRARAMDAIVRHSMVDAVQACRTFSRLWDILDSPDADADAKATALRIIVRSVTPSDDTWKIVLNLPGSDNHQAWQASLEQSEPCRLWLADGWEVWGRVG